MRAIFVSSLYSDPSARGKLRALAGLGVSVSAAIPGGMTGVDGGVRIAPIPVRGDSAEPDRLTWNRRALRRLFSDIRPEIVQVEEEPGTQVAAVAAAEARRAGAAPVLFSWQSLPASRGLFERLRARQAFRAAQGLIGGNRLAERLLAEAAPGRQTLALPQSGVLPPASPERPHRAGLAIGYVGRLVPERGVDRLLRACSQVMGQWTLTVIGTGPEQEALEALSQRLGLASRVRWLGGLSRAQITPLWTEFDCLVIPSRTTPTFVEKWSPLLAEAMSHGVTAVVTREGALPETVGEAGVIVDDDDALALQLQHLLADPARNRALGLEGRKRMLTEYLDTAIAEKTLAFWRRLRGS